MMKCLRALCLLLLGTANLLAQGSASNAAKSTPSPASSAAQSATQSAAQSAAKQATQPTIKPDAPAHGTTVPLWPAGAPKALGKTPEDTPTLTIFLPVRNTTKTGVIIAPGGGYSHLAMVHEGEDVAHWLNARGVAAFVLKYRLGPAYRHPIELGDAQRAMRLVRANAKEYGIAADHIGMWGFSAGGHLAATTGTHYDSGSQTAPDPVDRQGCRPDFLVLAYPVITLMEVNTHGGSRKNLLGDDPSESLLQSLSDETQVTKATPPTFIYATTDDGVVPVMNSVAFYSALVKFGVPAEMHLFQHGNHGVGLATGNPVLDVWPELLIKWMRERGLASAADAPPSAAVVP